MSNPRESTRIAAGGLRYQSKVSGSPFRDSKVSTRSCIKCGRHRIPDQLRAIRFLGRTEMVCAPTCDTAGG